MTCPGSGVVPERLVESVIRRVGRVSAGQGGDGMAKTGAVLFMEEVARDKAQLDNLIAAACAEVLKAEQVEP